MSDILVTGNSNRIASQETVPTHLDTDTASKTVVPVPHSMQANTADDFHVYVKNPRDLGPNRRKVSKEIAARLEDGAKMGGVVYDEPLRENVIEMVRLSRQAHTRIYQEVLTY